MPRRVQRERSTYDVLKPEFDKIDIALLKMGFSHTAIREAFRRYVESMPREASIKGSNEFQHK